MKTGLEAIDFYTPNDYLDMQTLAQQRNVDVDKYYHGIGQQRMSIIPPDEDIVTMAANAAESIIAPCRESLDTLFFATENLRAQVLMTGALSVLIFSGLLTVVAIDHPFAGTVKVGPDALASVVNDFADTSAEQQPSSR